MDHRFLPHNTHLDDPAGFSSHDPQLRRLARQVHVHTSALLARLPRKTPGIYTLSGGRQVGKTTLLKQWMSRLMEDGVAPEKIIFFSGKLIDDQHSLLRLLQEQLAEMPAGKTCYVLLDEVSKFTNEVQRLAKVLSWAPTLTTSPWKTDVTWPTYTPTGARSGTSRQLWIARHQPWLAR